MSYFRCLADPTIKRICSGIMFAAMMLGCFASCRKSEDEPTKSMVGSNTKDTDAQTRLEPKGAGSSKAGGQGNIRFMQIENALPGSEYRDGSQQNVFSLLETTGGGCALIDFDGDGRLDVVTSGGGYFDPQRQFIGGYPGNLYRQVSPWSFSSCRTDACLDFSATYHSSIVAADYDSDGMKDVLVTGYDRLLWFRNQGDGTFQEVRPVEDNLWSSSAVFFDADLDSDLDLYVVHYANWSWTHNPWCPSQADSNRRDYCGPTDFVGLADAFYENLADGTFTHRVIENSDNLALRGLGVIAADLDGDRDTDLYVSNDVEPNLLFRNDGGFQWTEIGRRAGVATNDQGRAEGSMGIALGDYNNDQIFDLWVTNYADEFNALYRGNGRLSFSYATNASRITATDEQSVGWGTAMCDLDLDGDEDILVVNGHLERFSSNRLQRPQVLENIDAKRFALSAKESPFFQTPQEGRGLAVGDLNRDGLVDLAVTRINSQCAIVENQSARQGDYLSIRLVGRASNRDAIGTVAAISIGDSAWIKQRVGGGSYASTSDSALHFGIPKKVQNVQVDNQGLSTKATLKIDWPSGQVSIIEIERFNKELLIVEPMEGQTASSFEFNE